ERRSSPSPQTASVTPACRGASPRKTRPACSTRSRRCTARNGIREGQRPGEPGPFCFPPSGVVWLHNKGGGPMAKLMAGAAGLLAAVAVVTSAHAQTQQDLLRDGNGGSTDNVLTYGMGYHQQRYSALKQVNKQTVKRLVPVWNLSLDNNWGEQAQPIVYNGVMYVTNARATVAIDVATGKQIWKQTLDWPPETPRVVCCGVSNKGAAIYDGKIFRTTLDAYVIAYDAKDGKELWKSKVAEWKDGVSLTLAPLIANGV